MQEKFGSLAVGLFNTTQAGVSLVGDSSKDLFLVKIMIFMN